MKRRESLNDDKRIMSIGAGPSQIYAITKAKSMGYEVVAIDINPESPGFKIADYPVKISTLDVEEQLRQQRI